ncbi:MAG: hypothetical protein Q4G71_16745 [Pseudomonadota bacterium]|nr:hypothetical protein [Pseudomonadota bacterium]
MDSKVPERPLSKALSPTLRHLPAALECAQQRARELARQTHTYLIVQQSGQLVKLKVD